MQQRDNHSALLDCFFGHVNPHESLCFFYAKRTPLMEDSRRSLKALAQISGLSSPSVAERLRRLEERGVLKGYTVEIDPKCFGYQLQAIVRIRP